METVWMHADWRDVASMPSVQLGITMLSATALRASKAILASNATLQKLMFHESPILAAPATMIAPGTRFVATRFASVRVPRMTVELVPTAMCSSERPSAAVHLVIPVTHKSAACHVSVF